MITSEISGRVIEVYPYDREFWRISIVSKGVGYYFSVNNIWKVDDFADTAGHVCWHGKDGFYCNQINLWKLPGESIAKHKGEKYFRVLEKKIYLEPIR